MDEKSLQLLNNRLTTSTYLEDRLDSLKIIREYVDKNPYKIALNCFSPLLDSMISFIHKNHFEILTIIFNSRNGREFVEMFLKNKKCLELIFKMRNKRSVEMFNLLCEFDNEKICNFFLEMSSSNSIKNEENEEILKNTESVKKENENIKKENENDLLIYFNNLNELNLILLKNIIKNKKLRIFLVSHNLIEKIFELFKKDEIKEASFLLQFILKDSIFCQNYFFNILDSFLDLKISDVYFFNILDSFLDLKNIKFPEFQERIHQENKILEKAKILKRFDFIQKYFYNRDGLEDFMQIFNFQKEFSDSNFRKSLLEIMRLCKIENVKIIDFSENNLLFFLNFIFKKYLLLNNLENLEFIKKLKSKILSEFDYEKIEFFLILFLIKKIQINEKFLDFEKIIKILNDENKNYELKGSLILIFYNEILEKNIFREEFLIFCLQKFKFYLYNLKNFLFFELLIFIEEEIQNLMEILNSKIDSRKKNKIKKIENKENKKIENIVEENNQLSGIIQNFRNIASRFEKHEKNDDDSLEL